MTHRHRWWHFWTWVVLGPLAAGLLIAALAARPQPVFESDAAESGPRGLGLQTTASDARSSGHGVTRPQEEVPP